MKDSKKKKKRETSEASFHLLLTDNDPSPFLPKSPLGTAEIVC